MKTRRQPTHSVRQTARAKRRGATLVEFAITAPILFLFIFSGIEFARVNVLRNTVSNAAFDGARRGIIAGASVADCVQEANVSLNAVAAATSTVTVTPDPLTNYDDTVTVRVDVPLTADNLFLVSRFFLGDTLSKSVTLEREVR